MKVFTWIGRGLVYGLGGLALAFVLVQAWFFGWVLYWSSYDPKTTNFMERRLDELRARQPKAQLKHQWVPYDRISPNLKRAVVAAEDARFLDHEGFDWEGIQRALEKNQQRGKPVAGGSTISQQLAKNLFLSGDRSFVRKGQEALITLMLEQTMSKRRILELYLNVAEWGQGVFGAEAAARHHFGKPAKELTVEEAALLAAILPSPRRYDPIRHTAYLNRRQHHIIRWLERRSGRRPHAISNGRRSAESEELSLTQD